MQVPPSVDLSAFRAEGAGCVHPQTPPAAAARPAGKSEIRRIRNSTTPPGLQARRPPRRRSEANARSLELGEPGLSPDGDLPRDNSRRHKRRSLAAAGGFRVLAPGATAPRAGHPANASAALELELDLRLGQTSLRSGSGSASDKLVWHTLLHTLNLNLSVALRASASASPTPNHPPLPPERLELRLVQTRICER